MQHFTIKGSDSHPDFKFKVWEFDSMMELVEAGNANPVKLTSNQPKVGKDFNLTEDYAEAYALATEGWHEIRAKVDGHMEPLRERLGDILGVTTERVHDMIGFEPDIDRYLANEMDCMWDDVMLEAPRSGKVFTLLVDASMTWNNKADDIAKRGAVLCALVESYIMLGYQLEIWIEQSWRGSGPKVKKEMATILTRVNKAGDLLDIDSMMFALGHPDWNRRITWAFVESIPHLREQYGFDGTYCGLNRNGLNMTERIQASAQVVLDGNTNMTRDPLAWILDQLEAQGIYEPADA